MSYIDEILNTTIIVSNPDDITTNFSIIVLEFIGSYNGLDYFWVDNNGYLEAISIDEWMNNIITKAKILDTELSEFVEDLQTVKTNKKTQFNLL